MKQVINCFWLTFCIFTFFMSSKNAMAEKNIPFFWSVEKGGKKAHLLGTYMGVSLKEDLECPNKILEQIENSDLIFMEERPELSVLSMEDKKAIYIGPKETQEELLNRFFPEIRRAVKNKKQQIRRLVKSLIRYDFKYKDRDSFKDFTEESQEFLINHGADIQKENLVEYIYFTFEAAFFEASISLGGDMNEQTSKIAQSNQIPIEVLDDSFMEINATTKVSQKRLPVTVSTGYIEKNYIRNYHRAVRDFRKALSDGVEQYKSSNEEFFEKFLQLSPEMALERNQLWLQQFNKALTSQDYTNIFFTAEGSHFVGSFNLIDFLKEEGFSVNRVTCP